MEKTIEECVENIQRFADKHNLEFNNPGEVGFGRPCVGLLKNDNYVAFNPYSYPNYDRIPEYYNEDHFDLAPERAYHKHDCLCVLGTEEDSLHQLSNWIDKLEKLNVEIKEYNTGATGFQALISGEKGYCLFLPN